jgi:eukaryotic-like serine/threonine-protein kinase
MIERAGELVTREELHSNLWPVDTFVDFDHGLNNAVARIREVLEDSSGTPRYIETIPRRGYRFIAPVSEVSSANGSVPATTRSSVDRETRLGVLVLAAVVVVLVVGGGWFWRTRRAGVLYEKDTIVLGDFANSTGDSVFDDTLKQALRVQLEQSPFLNVLSDQELNAELRLMGRSSEQPLTSDVARDLCQRLGSKAVLAGSIASLGTHYVIGLDAFNCHTGTGLGTAQMEADSKEHILRTLSETATKIRKQLGESLASVQKYDAPIEQATTPSLDALKAYTLGLRIWSSNGANAAIPFLRRAVELDPNFAMAYGRLGTAYAAGTVEAGLSTLNIRKAYDLREKVSDRERLYLESHYYHYATHELEKAAEIYELWEQIYPRDPVPSDNLVSVYSSLGKLEKALEQAQLTMRLSPDRVESYEDLSGAYLELNSWDQAAAVIKHAEEHKLESETLSWSLYLLGFLRGDAVEMKRVADSARDKPRMEAPLLAWEAFFEAHEGHPKKSRELWKQSVESALKDGGLERAATIQIGAGRIDAILGFSSEAHSEAEAALRLAANQDTEAGAAFIFAHAGDVQRARKLASELDGQYPLSDSIQHIFLPTIRAEIALHHEDADSAVEQLRATSPYDLGMGMSGPTNTSYVRGQAFLMQRNGGAATVEFERIVDHPGMMGLDPVSVLAHLGQARAYALQGKAAKSRAAYQDFFTLWKDADPDIPILQQAKTEYGKLK